MPRVLLLPLIALAFTAACGSGFPRPGAPSQVCDPATSAARADFIVRCLTAANGLVAIGVEEDEVDDVIRQCTNAAEASYCVDEPTFWRRMADNLPMSCRLARTEEEKALCP